LVLSDAPIESLTGSPVNPDRLQELFKAYDPILSEISKLRGLDLSEVHPAVIFEPTAAYRRAR
jgi:hypothetical protein